MKETKFRAWDNENKMFFEPTYRAYEGQLEELLISTNGRLGLRKIDGFYDESRFPDRFVLQQFTGLHDKNGKEIYEGDIIRKSDPPYFKSMGGDVEPSETDIRLHRGGTGYVEGCPFGYAVHEIDCGQWAFDGPEGSNWISDEVEIIGSIYENPELLKVKP